MIWFSLLFLAVFGGFGLMSRPLLALGFTMLGVAVMIMGTWQRPQDLIGGSSSPIMIGVTLFMFAALLAYLMGYILRRWRARI